MLFLTVLGWGISARAEETQPSAPSAETSPTPAPRPAFTEALGGISELVSQGALNPAEQFTPAPFLGRLSGRGLVARSTTLWRSSQLWILTLGVFNPEGASPFEPGEVVLKDHDGVELGRLPAKLAGQSLAAGQLGFLVVAWTQHWPKPPHSLEVWERNGLRSVQVSGGLQ